MATGLEDGLWTREGVEAKLLETLRPKPGVTIVRSGSRYRAIDPQHNDLVEPLNWPARFVPDPRERRMLQIWLRCRSETIAGAGFDASFATAIAERGWSRSTAEDVRRRAAQRIADGLNRDRTILDNRKTRIGSDLLQANRPSFIEA